jgi:lipopolysaccharide export system ATP-binding protein
VSFSAQGLLKRYGRRAVVDGVDLEVSRGETVGLLGPNGAGKTTSFYLMVGLVRANGGCVTLEGDDITRMWMHDRARRGIGYLPQENCAFRDLSVEDNVRAVLEWMPLTADERRDRLENLVADFHLGAVRHARAAVVSGGERRRTEIARALATDPKYLLLDEPFTGIDPIAVAELQDIITDLRSRDIGIIITDHNVRDTLTITDRSYIIHQGKILTSGTSDELLEDPVARRFYLGDRFRLT